MSDSTDEMTIELATKRVKLDDSENKDRLSDLPESIILHIMSFLNTEYAVRTCILSTKWKDIWKRLPALILRSYEFRSMEIFKKIVSNVLSLRDSSISLQSLDFERYNCRFETEMLKTVVNYALTHNVQRIGLYVNGGDIAQIPPTMFSCETLTHLKLSIHNGIRHKTVLFPESLNLPALTSLQLGNFTFCVRDNDSAEPFSILNRLNNLLISDCTVKGTDTLCISSATLVNLTIYNNSNDYYKIELRTPSLCTFAFCGTPCQSISGSNVSSLKHVDIHAEAEVVSYSLGPPMFLFSWLLEFANIKSLTVTATTLQVLSLFPGMFKFNFPSLGNLKSLRVEFDEIPYKFRMLLCKVKLLTVESEEETARITKAFELGSEPSPPIPVGMVDFLLQNSSSAEVKYVLIGVLPYHFHCP
ncbi:F-box family protein [Trifolium pratense]|uniref:F-box family protein n=1 Tax=Trifolium pratense TaxID=57577 RepID=A0A2K3MMP9_TRIPR|nr:F-box family protein [Trifolium pratense]